MPAEFFLDAIRTLHLLGLAVGLGLALCADVLALKSMILPISRRDVWLLGLMHRAILIGLGLLWGSGIALLHIRTGWDPAQFSPKLTIKLAVVAVLSLNALLVGFYVLPTFERHSGRLFGDIGAPARIGLSAIAGLSLSCWVSALGLGAFGLLRAMGFDGLQMIFAPLFTVGLGGAILLGVGAGLIARLDDLAIGSLTRPPRDWPGDAAARAGRVRTMPL